jgi:hypothetical protein
MLRSYARHCGQLRSNPLALPCRAAAAEFSAYNPGFLHCVVPSFYKGNAMKTVSIVHLAQRTKLYSLRAGSGAHPVYTRTPVAPAGEVNHG